MIIDVNDWDGEQVNVVICGDNKAVFSKMKLKPDLTFTSPPYAVSKVVSAYSEAKVAKGHKPYDYYDYDEHDDDEYHGRHYFTWLREAVRHSRITFWNVPAKQFDRNFGVSEKLLSESGIGQVIWQKPNSMPFPKRGVMYFHELIWIFGDKKRIHTPFKSVWEAPTTRWSKHPAPFPPELPARAIQHASREGDLIFDPFGGSGTTAATAKALKRNYLTCDISPEYCKWMVERLEKTKTV